MLLNEFLLLGAVLFCIGVYGVIARKNAVMVLMSIEVILNSVNINLLAFSQLHNNLDGNVFALYIIAVNPTRTARRSTITAAGLAGRPVGVLEEGRSVPSSGDSFSDSFAPLAVHLYVVTPS